MKNKKQWNKLLGIASVIILFGTTYYSLADSYKNFKNDQPETTAPAKENTANNTKDKNNNDKDTTNNKKNSDLPDVSVNDWQLSLVGPFNKIKEEIPEDQLVNVADYGEEKLDKRIAEEYTALAAAAQEAGFQLVPVSAFRSIASQQTVFDGTVAQKKTELNLSDEDAITKAKETVTEPGFSEHHTGLAVDVVDGDWYNNYTEYAGELLDEAYGKRPGAEWLAKNVANYGFIIRYLDGAEKITGITYEPWHLRYVGKESAQYITKHNITLEEYLELLEE
ncbi:D-alanyl-D-alanine carboxypeptidase [Enterococcus sp. PF1-24]|uniref:M15 family metallopeptidase n=1 Tax=unclassified Enterococcus TaxID=2608891 RepID=UPI002475BFF4|nr:MULTISPECIES: M15 family metallopeptidase [unclassified Enterococcus]MDH6365192.1 D-alanyl-D-alanine carboxypeptidase [Enterococcus sp. PFB1-1]MDH6402293.1 D-alanyl-D-alanine carboxypeptidase [Enterococcus sp. PF1-24]